MSAVSHICPFCDSLIVEGTHFYERTELCKEREARFHVEAENKKLRDFISRAVRFRGFDEWEAIDLMYPDSPRNDERRP